MRGPLGFFDVDERLKELSAKGDAITVIRPRRTKAQSKRTDRVARTINMRDIDRPPSLIMREDGHSPC